MFNMNNIIKSQLFQNRKNVILIIASAVVIIVPLLLYLMNDNCSEMTGGIAAYSVSDLMPMLVSYYIFLSVPLLFSSDTADKTMNYEILSGHSRTKVFWSRIYVVYMITIPAIILSLILPVAAASAVNGFGANIKPGELAVMFASFICIAARMISEIIFLTFLVEKPLVSMVLSMPLEGMIMLPAYIIPALNGDEYTGRMYYSSLYRLSSVLDFSNSKTGFYKGEDIIQFVTEKDICMRITDTAGAMLMAVILLLLTFSLFKRKDL